MNTMQLKASYKTITCRLSTFINTNFYSSKYSISFHKAGPWRWNTIEPTGRRTIEILQIEETCQPEACQLGRERVNFGLGCLSLTPRLARYAQTKTEKTTYRLSLSLSPSLQTDVATYRSGLWHVSSIYNISMRRTRRALEKGEKYCPLYKIEVKKKSCKNSK